MTKKQLEQRVKELEKSIKDLQEQITAPKKLGPQPANPLEQNHDLTDVLKKIQESIEQQKTKDYIEKYKENKPYLPRWPSTDFIYNSFNDIPCIIEQYFKDNPDAPFAMISCSCPRCSPQC